MSSVSSPESVCIVSWSNSILQKQYEWRNKNANKEKKGGGGSTPKFCLLIKMLFFFQLELFFGEI